jgi:streptogramin lyase
MGQVTKSGQNNITSPAGNSLAVFVDGVSGVLKLKDIRGNIQPFSDYISGSGGIPSLQAVLNVGNTATVPDASGGKAILVTLGGIGTVNNPDGFVVNNNGRDTAGDIGRIYSFITYLTNQDNVGFSSHLNGDGGKGFHAYISENSDKEGLAYSVEDKEDGFLFSVDELGNLIAKKIAIKDGTSDQYLMADGSTTTGGGSSAPIQITKEGIDTLISTNSLSVGSLYEITGVHPTLYDDGTNSGTTIYLQAITNNALSAQGNGIFYNPKYNQEVSGFGIWSNRSGWVASQNSSSVLGETGEVPIGITIDGDGNIYTANAVSNDVSKITPDGISTILGTTEQRPLGITIDAEGNIYTVNQNSNNVSKITPDGTSTILGTTGANPVSITIDGDGNIYTANQNSNNVSKITPLGVSSILGTTGAQPFGITIDADGNIYTSNQSSNDVSKITPLGVSTILGTITGVYPFGITVDTDGNVYTANFASNDVSKITPLGVSTILGTTGTNPYGITLDAEGNVYTANNGSDNISKITPNGTSTILGITGTNPYGITIDASGNTYTANQGSNDVSKITQSTAQFNSNENITANNGATGQLFQTLDWNMFIATSGDWASATSITGVNTGANASVTDIVLQSYPIGSKTIWGGYSWTNINGNVGVPMDIFNLDPFQWQKDVYDEVNYNKVVDLIEYDINNDWISRRHEVEFGNDIIYTLSDLTFIGSLNYAISSFMFGNGYNSTLGVGIINNLIENSFFECVNFMGSRIQSNTLTNSGIYSNTLMGNSYIAFNILTNNSIIAFNILTNNSTITLNTLINYSGIESSILTNSSIQENTLISSNIQSNTLSNNSSIHLNTSTNSGIYSNTLTTNSSIQENTLTDSSIISNTLIDNSIIQSNTQTSSGHIQSNTLTSNGYMRFNTLTNGRIESNTLINSSRIESNTLNNSNIQIGLSFPLDDKFLQFNIMENATIDVDVTGATIIYSDFPKTIYKKPDGTIKLRYYNNADTLVFADITD